MKQCFACFSSFIISKALGWIFFFFSFLALVSNGRARKTPSEWMLGWSRDTERPSYYHLQRDAQASRCVYYVPYMQLLSVDFSFRAVWLLTVHQILISGARDEPSSNHIRHGEAITAGPFFSHGVFSQWQAHWLCCFWTRSSPLSLRRGTSPRYTDRDGRAGGRAETHRGESDTHQAHSPVTVTT